MEKITIGSQIKSAREAQNLTLDVVKTKAGISLDTLRRYEKDKCKSPSNFVLRAIEKALGIKID